MFRGSIVALVTPMTEVGEIAYTALLELVERQLVAGTQGIVVLGTTGESSTVEQEERLKIIQTVVRKVQGAIPVIVGAGAASTKQTIALAQMAQEAGADGVLLVTPYYNRPTQEGLYLHYRAVAKAVSLPQILYNVPARTGCDLLPETVLRLEEYENIVAIKEAVPGVERLRFLQAAGSRLRWLSGDDVTAEAAFLAGGDGVISVAANILPKECAYLMSRECDGEGTSRRIHYRQRLAELLQCLFLETNPIVVKWALSALGWIPSGIRLPLTCLEKQYHGQVTQILKQLALFE